MSGIIAVYGLVVSVLISGSRTSLVPVSAICAYLEGHFGTNSGPGAGIPPLQGICAPWCRVIVRSYWDGGGLRSRICGRCRTSTQAPRFAVHN